MDRITLTGIEAWGHHGVLGHERELGQRFVVDVEVVADLSAAGTSDELADTIDYGALAEQVVAVLEGTPRRLVEAVAERIADVVLEHPRAVEATVTVHKPAAPFTVPVGDVAVSIVRRRGDGSPAGT